MTTIFTLNRRDWLRGLVMAALVPVLYIIQSSVEAGDLVFKWPQIVKAAIGGGVAYLLKNYFTNDIPAAKKTLADARLKEMEKPSNQVN